MTPRTLSLLAVFTAAACGSGRLVPADTAEPAGAGAPSEPAVATPAPGTTTETAPVAPNAPADPNASGYAPPANDTTNHTPAAATTPGTAPAAPAPAGTSAGAAAPSGTALPLRRIGQWSTSGVTAPARLIIRDDSSYAEFWNSLGPGAGARPAVDFSRDIVIAAAAGQQSTGGHTIAVQQVTRVGDGLAIQVLETTPAEGCNVTQALTQPVDVVVVNGAGAQTWSFSENKQAQPC